MRTLCEYFGLPQICATPAAGQRQASIAAPSDGPRTPWGDPDLQEVWDYWTFTPLQRPENLADKEVLTDEEVALFAQQAREAAIAVDRNGPRAGARRRNRGRSNDVDADVDQGDSGQHAKDAPDEQEWSWH